MITSALALTVLSLLIAATAWVVGLAVFLRVVQAAGKASAGLTLLAVFAWPALTDRVRKSGSEHDARIVNRALVVLMAALLVAFSAAALYANFTRIATRP